MQARAWLCVALLMAMVVPAGAAELEDSRLYECGYTDQPPKLDGVLDDACWQQANATGEFTRIIKGPAQIHQTQFRVVYDEANLYIGVTCLESKPGSIVAQVRSNDQSAVMADDAIEIFLHPDPAAPEYYQLAANSIGTRYDGLAFNSAWNGEWQAAGSVGEDAWYLECALGFASLGHHGAPGAVWGFNVCRDRNAGGDTEWSAWSDTMGGFHVPERFGRLVFGSSGGGVTRAALIECARYAARSIELERRINADLELVRTGKVSELSEAEQARVISTAAAGREALEAMRALVAGEDRLSVAAWLGVTADLQSAADELDRLAWAIRIATLLADD